MDLVKYLLYENDYIYKDVWEFVKDVIKMLI